MSFTALDAPASASAHCSRCRDRSSRSSSPAAASCRTSADETTNWTPTGSTSSRTTRCSREIIRERSSSSRRSRRAFPTAATRSRRYSNCAYANYRAGETPRRSSPLDRFIRTLPEPPERRLRVLPQGPRQLPRGPGPPRLRLRARPVGARSEGDARIVSPRSRSSSRSFPRAATPRTRSARMRLPRRIRWRCTK